MNDFELLSYLLTWLLAFIFFLLWRSNRDRADGLEDDLQRMTKAMEYYKQRFEVDEHLLTDPEIKFVGSCQGCAIVTDENDEPCKVLLSFDNYTKDNYCSQYRRKESNGSNLQTAKVTPIPRGTKTYEGTLKRIENKHGALVGEGNGHNAETDIRSGDTGNNDRPHKQQKPGG